MHFEKKWGSLYFMSGPNIVYMVDELAIAFDRKNFTRLKHGRPKDVLKWVETVQRLDKEQQLFPDIAVVQGKPDAFDVEDLNKMLDISGYMKVMARKYGFFSPRHPALPNAPAPEEGDEGSGI